MPQLRMAAASADLLPALGSDADDLTTNTSSAETKKNRPRSAT
jgi:hypothetical protein